VSILRAPSKPRQRRPHERSVAVLIRPSADQPDLYIRIRQDDAEAHYWIVARPSDYGRSFAVEKPGHEGAEVYDVLLDAAVLFSFTSTCQRLGVEPWAYLQDVLTRLPATPAGQLGDLLPDHWQAAREAKMAIPPALESETPAPSVESAS
jgi:hypothetical protein